MDSGKAILVDVLQLLPLVEERLVGDGCALPDTLELTSLRQSLELLEVMIDKCDTVVSAEEIDSILQRINVARETVDLLSKRSSLNATNVQYRDMLLLPEHATTCEDRVVDYGKCLNMSNEEFDALIDEWAEDRDGSSVGVRSRRKSRVGSDDAKEQIRSDLVKLADTMKSKALWYRDLLVKDNEVLSKYTMKQEKQLDTVTQVASEASKLAKTTRLSLRQSLFMIASLFLLTVFMLMIFIIT
ncbi:uncharacterized protein BXIN_1864 [Babesia sp. Xinjiang]|uniref:uncharacterized protein n=1 Tax=Babesia sp. Xinjiang TaxID=462227 RepID=UPI000A21FCA3|nr:uncharacterized protein BXIN_1864 [Babesia sp. Xinjiang]ORM40406.1 hypothetical protein BXIN_1864 [Babesia sp. Xinjiang]